MKRLLSLILTVMLVMTCVVFTPTAAFAANYDSLFLIPSVSKLTVYLGEVADTQVFVSCTHRGEISSDEFNNIYNSLNADAVWTISDPSVVRFARALYSDETGMHYEYSDKETSLATPRLMGLKEGTATITVSSKLYNKSASIQVTVAEAELKCVDGVYYGGNEYEFKLMSNTVKPLEFTSSVTTVASIDAKTGVMKGLTQGKTVISCKASNGKTYTQTINVYNPCLSYSNITSYYFTGYAPGCYSYFPIIAKGIKVKSWSSSNQNVVKVNTLASGTIGNLEIHGCGKCVVTCTDVNGKIYKCNVTIVGGTKWCGLGGYTPTVAQAKTHGYYNDINSIRDFGTSVSYIVDYANKFSLGNGRTPMTMQEAEMKAEQILKERYPGKTIHYAGAGDLVMIKQGKERARIWNGLVYVDLNEPDTQLPTI